MKKQWGWGRKHLVNIISLWKVFKPDVTCVVFILFIIQNLTAFVLIIFYLCTKLTKENFSVNVEANQLSDTWQDNRVRPFTVSCYTNRHMVEDNFDLVFYSMYLWWCVIHINFWGLFNEKMNSLYNKEVPVEYSWDFNEKRKYCHRTLAAFLLQILST